MRVKTNRRLILLVSAVGLAAVGAFSLYFVRGWQKERMTNEFFARGQEEFKAGQYYRSLNDTAQFLSRVKSRVRNTPDKALEAKYVDALYAYAESRRLIEEPDGQKNIREAIPFYQQYREYRPDDAKTTLTLLQSLNQVGLSTEARDLALKSFPKGIAQAKDVEILHELLAGLRGSAKKDLLDARLAETADRLIELNPLDIPGQLVRMEIDVTAGRKAQARARADQLVKDHPQAPEAMLIAAIAREIDPKGDDLKERHTLLARAAGLDPATVARVSPATYSDESFVLRLVMAFDSHREFDFSLAVLDEATQRLKSELVKRLLVRRLWQENENDKVLALTQALDPAKPESNAELLGFRASSLQRTGKTAEAGKIAAALAAREGDFRAAAWAVAIPLMDPNSTLKPADAVAGWKPLVSPKGWPGEPVFHVYSGMALANAGRMDEARSAWQNASGIPAATGWFVPALRTAESLVAEGRFDEASRAADDAVSAAPNRAGVIATWFEAHAARIQGGSTQPPTAAAILPKLEEAITKLPPRDSSPEAAALCDRFIVPHVILLSRVNRGAEAKAEAVKAIERNPAPAPAILQRLAAVSASEHLGVETQAMSRVEATTGQTSSVLFVKASDLAAAGKPDEAVALLKNAAQQHPEDRTYAVAHARLLERLGKDEAITAWTAIGDAAPNDLDVQRLCLQSPAAAGDSAFIERCVERYTRLTGGGPPDGDAVTNIARARAALWGKPTKANRDRATSLLARVVSTQPGMVDAKVLLAQALTYSDPARGITPDYARAAAQLSDAVAIEPRNAGIAINLATILQRDRQFEKARAVLTPIAQDTTADLGARRVAATMLAEQGDPSPTASEALADIAARMGQSAPASLLVELAEAYAAQRQDAKAQEVYERLAAGAANDADSIYMTARFYTLRAQAAKVGPILAKLEGLKLDAGVREFIQARLASDAGDINAAVPAYESSLKAAPKRPDIWRAYFRALVSAGKNAEAQQVARRAASALPEDQGLVALAEQAAAFKADAKELDEASLIKALAADPTQAEAAEALRSVVNADAKGQRLPSDALAAIADKFPTSSAVQLFVINRLRDSDRGRAITIARRAMSQNPTDPLFAQMTSDLLAAENRWADVLEVAQEWQRRELGRSLDADLAVAEAYIRLKNYSDKALQTLAPRIEAAKASPTSVRSLDVLNLQARLLVGARKDAQARELLAPLLPTSPTVRTGIWLAIATEQAPDVATGRSWLEQLAAQTPADAALERVAVAMGYASLARSFPAAGKELVATSIAKLTELTKDPQAASAAAWEALGMTLHGSGQPDEAIPAYRKAIELDGNRSIALNNLASILVERPGNSNLEEALKLAQRAVDADPKNPSNLDTLATALAQTAAGLESQSRADDAVKNYKRAGEALVKAGNEAAAKGAEDPTGYRVRAAGMFEHAGDRSAALACYEELLTNNRLRAEDAAAIKNNTAMCLLLLNRSKADLDRAVTLALEATRVSNEPMYLDTLGWCYLSADRVQDAIGAFQTAVNRAASGKSPLTSASIGLATALAKGTAEQRAQAQKVLAGVDPARLQKEDAEHYKAAKSLLEK